MPELLTYTVTTISSSITTGSVAIVDITVEAAVVEAVVVTAGVVVAAVVCGDEEVTSCGAEEVCVVAVL